MNTSLKRARKPITDEGAKILAAAIMQSAIDDWFDVQHRIFKLKKKCEKKMASATSPGMREEIMLRYEDEILEKKREIRKIESFFNTELYASIMNIEKSELLALLHDKLKEKIARWESPSSKRNIKPFQKKNKEEIIKENDETDCN